MKAETEADGASIGRQTGDHPCGAFGGGRSGRQVIAHAMIEWNRHTIHAVNDYHSWHG